MQAWGPEFPLQSHVKEQGVVVHARNPHAGEADTGRPLSLCQPAWSTRETLDGRFHLEKQGRGHGSAQLESWASGGRGR